MIWARTDMLLGAGVAHPLPKIKNVFFIFVRKKSMGQGLPASPWPGTSQVLPTPGGRDSGRLGLSVRTWLAEAATAADLKGGSGEAKPLQEKKFKLVLGCLNLGEMG